MHIPVVRLFLLISSMIWVVALVVNFIMVYKNEATIIREKQLDDHWLLLQCEDPVFAARLFHYQDPCAGARLRMQMNVHIVAFHHTLDQIFLCGSYSCEGLVWMLLDRVRANLVVFFVVLILLLILVPTLLMPLWKRWTDNLTETHLRHKCLTTGVGAGHARDGQYFHTQQYQLQQIPYPLMQNATGGCSYSAEMFSQHDQGQHGQRFAHPRSYPQQRVLQNS
jgi:hypothetical protein